MLDNVREIIEGVSNSYGDDFFNKIALSLDNVIRADYTFIARLDRNNYSSRTIALVAKGELVDNIEYSLKDTPCANAADDSICCYPKDVCAAFPNDQLLIDMKIEAYLGTPLHDSNHEVMGLVVALYEKPIDDEQEVLTLFQIFSGRIAAELERREYENSLEEKVTMRTEELSSALEQLTITQDQLIESEKMAALGNLVSGIAHEVNTPLGIAITTHSIMADKLFEIKTQIKNQTLTHSCINSYISAVEDALKMQGSNLERAKNLIESFKQTAVDQHILEVETIEICNYYKTVLTTLDSLLKPFNVALEVQCEAPIKFATFPGIHAQILTNLVANSVTHGFTHHTPSVQNKILIQIKQTNKKQIEIIYSDNGAGLSEYAQQHVFEPFFTTSRETGNAGLGMAIIFNLITQKLKGSIKLLDSVDGARFKYCFTDLSYLNVG